MAKKTKTVKDLSIEVEILSEKFRSLEEKVSEKDEKIKTMENIIKRNEEKIMELDKMLTENKKKPKNQKAHFYCKECGKSLTNKYDLTMHIRKIHPKE